MRNCQHHECKNFIILDHWGLNQPLTFLCFFVSWSLTNENAVVDGNMINEVENKSTKRGTKLLSKGWNMLLCCYETFLEEELGISLEIGII